MQTGSRHCNRRAMVNMNMYTYVRMQTSEMTQITKQPAVEWIDCTVSKLH